jgi:hypothetical protein
MNAWIVKFHIIDISTNIDNYLEKKIGYGCEYECLLSKPSHIQSVKLIYLMRKI